MTVNGFPNGFHICYTEDNLLKIKELYDYHQNGSKPILYSLNLKEMGEKTLINNDSFKDQTIISPISYYGYLYPGHESGNWYIITQVALWQKLLPEANIYLCNEDKTKYNYLDDLLLELNNLVKRNTMGPSFGNNIKLNPNKEIILIDENNILKDYHLTQNNIDAKIDDNKLIINSKNIGEYTIYLEKDVGSSNNIVYQNSQGNYYIKHFLGYKNIIKINILVEMEKPMIIKVNNNSNNQAIINESKSVNNDIVNPATKADSIIILITIVIFLVDLLLILFLILCQISVK